MKNENKILESIGVVLCEECNEIVGDSETFKSFPNNPTVRFACKNCKYKTEKKNPYFAWRL